MGNCHGKDFIGAGGGGFFGDQFHGGQFSGG